MNKSPDAKGIVGVALATWPFAFVFGLIEPNARYLAAYWIPIGLVVMILGPAAWYIVRYIPDDIRNHIASRRR